MGTRDKKSQMNSLDRNQKDNYKMPYGEDDKNY